MNILYISLYIYIWTDLQTVHNWCSVHITDVYEPNTTFDLFSLIFDVQDWLFLILKKRELTLYNMHYFIQMISPVYLFKVDKLTNSVWWISNFIGKKYHIWKYSSRTYTCVRFAQFQKWNIFSHEIADSSETICKLDNFE